MQAVPDAYAQVPAHLLPTLPKQLSVQAPRSAPTIVGCISYPSTWRCFMQQHHSGPTPAFHACCLPVAFPRDSAEKFAGRPCLGWRTKPEGPEGKLGPYSFMTYKEAWDKAVKVRAHLLSNSSCWTAIQCMLSGLSCRP